MGFLSILARETLPPLRDRYSSWRRRVVNDDTPPSSPTTRHASCRCGQVRIACSGEPIRVSVCHCRECKARSGSAFAAQVRFPAEQVRIEGEANAKMWQYTGDSGHTADFFFCATCGSGVWYRARPYHDAFAIPLGNFEPGHGFVPDYSVYEDRMEHWVSITGEAIEHHD